MTIIYVVTSGRYSDYRIEAMFSTEERAKKYIARRTEGEMYHDFNEIKQYELDSANDDWLDGKTNLWMVWMKAETADVISVNKHNDDPGESMVLFDGNRSQPATIRVMVYADTQDRAVKVAMERRSIFLANGQG